MDVWDCALGFMDAQVLLTAEELGVFNVLSLNGAGINDVVLATGLPDDSAQRLLIALCAMGLVTRKSDDLYVNGPEAIKFLVPSSADYIGSMFRHLKEDLYPMWANFREALFEQQAQWDRTFQGECARNDQIFDDPNSLHAFMKGMHAISYGAAREFADQASELQQVEHIVDVGGASGAFIIALAQHFSNIRGTVFDLPAVQPIAEDYFSKSRLNGRVRFKAGDFWEDPLPEEADAYALGFILHDWDRTGGSILLEKIAQNSRPGGLLIIGEYVLNEDRTGPWHVARQDLNMLVAARGRERSVSEYADWIQEFGFQMQRVIPTHFGKHFMIAKC